MRIYKIILAGILCTGLFITGCQSNTKSGTKNEKADADEKKEKPEKLTFDCLSDSMVPLGYIDTSWSYVNPPLGIKFKFPKGWNATEDISNNGATIVPVGWKLSEFREQYTRQHYLKLSLMKGKAWGEQRFLFGVTRQPPIEASDTSQPDFNKNSLLIGQIFYGKEFLNEEDLYKTAVSSIKEEWQNNKRQDLIDLNKATIDKVVKESVNNTDYYILNIKQPAEKGFIYGTSIFKKIDCLFLVIYFNWHNEKERTEMMGLLQGLEVGKAG